MEAIWGHMAGELGHGCYKTGFFHTVLPGYDSGWRLDTVTDSLGRQTTYQYKASANSYPTDPNTSTDPDQRLLMSVTRPAVEGGSPTVTFHYARYDLPDTVLDPVWSNKSHLP